MGVGALEPWHLIVILVIVLVVFGTGRLGEVGGAIGKGIREFKSATKDDAAAAAQSAKGAGIATSVVVPPTTTVVIAAPVEVKCPSCATVNPPGQVFCGQCGTRVIVSA